MLNPDGSDAIFVTGAPGSKWSAIAYALLFAVGVDLSDISPDQTQISERGPMHVGNYFGPGMEFGGDFEAMSTMSKEELLGELSAPFSDAAGAKILKSHMFSRNLKYLVEMFPKARILLVYRDNADCLSWWQQAGGFAISYPDYSWYDDTPNMRAQIAIDNQGILDFTAQRGIRLVRHRSMHPILNKLRLNYNSSRFAEIANSPIGKHLGVADHDVASIEDECHQMARLAKVAAVDVNCSEISA